MTSSSVRQAAAMPDMNHRDPAFVDIFRDTKRRLLGIYPGMTEGWRPYLIGGSGTAAVEAMITSCVREGPVLLIDSGYYSARMRSKLVAHEIPFEVLPTEGWLAPIDLAELDRTLGRGRFEAVVTTHHETTAGRLHRIAEIGAICSIQGARLFVDAMSSFGADELDAANVGAIAGSANKCLHGLPGLSFVLVREPLAAAMPSHPRRTVYLDLPLYEGDSPPLTPPVPILTALRQALMEMPSGGAAGRRAVYLQRAELLRAGLADRGFRFAIEEAGRSCTLTTVSVPAGWRAEGWLQANREMGFMLYPTKGELHAEWFQVANMGELTDDHLRLWLSAVDDLLERGP